MANNPKLFNAVLAGAIGANFNQRNLTDPSADSYLIQRNAAIVVANGIDAAIPFDSQISGANINLLQSIVTAILNNRAFTAAMPVTDLALAIAALYNELTPVLLPESGGGTTIPNGSYDGQPIKWNGTSYVPVDSETGPLKLTEIENPDTASTRIAILDASIQVQGITATLTDALLISIIQTESNRFVAAFNNSIDPLALIEGTANGLRLQATKIGFFEALPVVRQSIVGVSSANDLQELQDEVDSVILAGVTLGLWTDNRMT